MNQAKIYDELQSLRNELDYYTVVTAITENSLNHRSFSDSAAKAILIYLVTSILGRNNNSNIVLASWGLLKGYNANSLNTGRGHLGRRRVKLAEDIAYTGDPNNLDKKENAQYEQIAKIYTEKYQTPEQIKEFIDAALNSEFYNREADRAILPEIYIEKRDTIDEKQDAIEAEPELAPEEPITDEPEPAPEPITENPDADEPVIEIPEESATESPVEDPKKRPHKKLRIAIIAAVALILLIAISVPIFLNNYSVPYTIGLKGRYDGNKTWNEELYNARVGDVVQFQAKFVNDRGTLGPIIKSLGDMLGLEITTQNVKLQFVLPPNLEYIEDSTLFFSSNYQDGILLSSNDVATTGINIGNYYINGNSYVRINCRIINNDLQVGENEIPVQVIVTVSDQTQSDEFIVHLVY